MDQGSRSTDPVTLIASTEAKRAARKLARRWFSIGWMLAITGGAARWHYGMDFVLWLVLLTIACITCYAVIDGQIKRLNFDR